MNDIVIIGGGMCGLLTGMLLADDGHKVTVLERDLAEPPDIATESWAEWERSSVRQFRLGHFFLPRFRIELEANLPRVIEALVDAGALVANPIEDIPADFSGGVQPDDDRFRAVTGRRPVVEAVVAGCAAETERLTVRRGVTVAKLLAEESMPVHITGVESEEGERFMADLVVDASGRNSGLPRLLKAVGAAEVTEEVDDSGFVYFGRNFRSGDGSVPPIVGGGLQPYGSISTLTLAADNGTWQVVIVASGRDAPIRKVRSAEVFDELWSSFPLVAHWLDGEPLSDDVVMMANLEDRIRRFVVDGAPVATGLAPVGDSWACTNPSVGRGASMAVIHAVALRDLVRERSPMDDPTAWSLAWDQRTRETVEPYYRETLSADRHRLAEIEAVIADETYESDDPAHRFSEALPVAAMKDPTVLRAYLDSFMLIRPLAELMADDQLVARTLELAANDGEPQPKLGLDRGELLALLG